MKKEEYTALLVEDSKIVLLQTARFLKKNGFQVITAEDGDIAIEIYKERSHEIDVIISDLLMPNLDGYEFALYNYNRNRLPFVVYSVINDAASAIKLLGRGVYFYVQKPYVPEKFISYIIEAIHRKRFHEDIQKCHAAPSRNLDSITISSTKEGLMAASNWFSEKNKTNFQEDDLVKLVHNFNEMLLNSYEHGSLGISEEEKTELIQKGIFDEYIEELEKKCSKEMIISQSTLKEHIAISIKDEGAGFNYQKYLDMTPDEILERINLPNGRGIYISTIYFDTIKYSDGGRNVVLVKSL